MKTRARYSERPFAAILEPAVRLMARTRFWVKCALVVIGFLVPMSVVAISYLNVQRRSIEFAKREQLGLRYLKPSVDLLVALNAQRAATVEALWGSVGPLVNSATAVSAATDGLGRASSSAAALGLTRKWLHLRHNIRMVLASAPAVPPATEVRLYNNLTGELERLISADGNNSNLILDPSSDSFYLMDAALNRLTMVVDLAGEASDQATLAGLSSPSVTRLLTFEDVKQNLETAVAATNSDYAAAFAHTRDHAVSRDLGPVLARLDAELVPLRHSLAAAVADRLNVAQLQRLGRAASRDAHALETATIAAAQRLVVNRIAGYSANETRTLLITLAGLVFLLWLFLGFYLYMSRSVGRILDATAAVADRGDVSTVVDTVGTDELADVSHAVDRVMDYLRSTAGAANRIAEGDLSGEVEVKSPDDQLSIAFSKMIVSLRAARMRDDERMAHLETHDPLTGLINRRAFDEAFEDAIAGGRPGALVLLDLDHFKYTNETYGHKMGDVLVAELAVALGACLGDAEVLARLGGDEFCVLAAGASLDHAGAIAQDLLGAVRSHVMVVDDVPVRTTASIGVIGFQGPCSAADLLGDADRAMYASKEAGRDRITVVADADRVRLRQSMRTAGEHMIRSALAEDRLELYVQPIVNLTTGVMGHCEVLLRMRSESGELIAPGEFLPIAERLGLIRPIDYWVIEHAIAEAGRHPDLVFEINLSGATIDDSGLESFVGSQLDRYDVDPHRIVFELTETAAVNNLPGARELAMRLSDLGCEFAIDDFGTGFSTFYYLKHFPAKYVKIDGEFMTEPQSRMDQLVIESIVRIGREVGKLTIAEYVGDHAAMERARALGVDYGQGYFFSRPFPIDELVGMSRNFWDVRTGAAGQFASGRAQAGGAHEPASR